MSNSTSPQASAATVDEDETPWVDASIRWTDEKNENHQGDHADSEADERAILDPFTDPDPTVKFIFSFDNTMPIMLNGYKPQSDAIWKSTGLTVWRAAEHLCHYLLKQQVDIFGENNGESDVVRVLELGAGLGLCGILAHRLLTNDDRNIAKSAVLLTDGDTDALVLLRENVKRNTRTSSTPDGDHTISCRQLLWGRETSEALLKKHKEKFHIILASDVVYAANIIQPLWETVRTLLRQDGVFLFAYCSRRQVPVTMVEVLTAADNAGFSHECVDDSSGVLVYVFRWRTESPISTTS